MKKIVYTLLLSLLSMPMLLLAQSHEPEVTSYVEPDTVQIGDLFTYTIEVKRDMAQVSEFPIYNTTQQSEKGANVELVEAFEVDTLSREGRRLHLRKRYLMQVFDEGIINMGRGSVLYADKNVLDTLYGGDSVYLTILPIEIDSVAAANGLRDIKPQKDMPFKFGEISGYVTWSVAIIALLALAVFIVIKVLAHYGRNLGDLFKPAPPLPPHVVAIRALEALHHRKLWQNEKYKLYYSELTDILRTYIAGRYGIGAMEMTSDEILEAMRTLSEQELPRKASMDLTRILREADLVKFAKAEPSAEENEAAYTMAYYFVEETKIQEPTPSEGEGIDAKE